MMNKFARIIGTGSYLPPKVVTNTDLEQTLDTSDEWITTRTGIKQRHIAENESTVFMAKIAANNALEMANIDASELDLIILATTTPDKIFPASATMLQHAIGASCPAFDLQAVCAGFIFALTTAESYIKAGNYNKVLVVGSESMSKIINWQDRNTAVLFGDGAGAVVLSADDNTGILHSQIFSDGKYLSSLQTTNNQINESGYIEMAGNEVFKIAVNNLSSLAENTLKECNLTSDDIDFMVPHQANIRIIRAVAKKIKLPMDKVVITVDKHGNTSAASIPLALDIAVRDGRIKQGHKLLFEGIGGGFSWGSILVEF
jgi:3-oxoacyl-[acyl-carrier-protein] synthase-3